MRVLSYIFLLVFIINLNAKKSWMIKGGGNVSSFQDNDSEPNRNYSIGLSKNIIFHKNPSMFWELLFTEQGAQIQDEPVKTIYYPFELYAYDISVSILYAELPLFFGYHHFYKKLQVMWYVGPSIRTTIRDYTEKSNGEIIYNSPENENYDEYQTCPFEFVQDDFEGPILFKNTAWGVNIGLSLTFHRYSIDIRYTNVLESVGQIGQFLLIERKLEALNFMVGYNF